MSSVPCPSCHVSQYVLANDAWLHISCPPRSAAKGSLLRPAARGFPPSCRHSLHHQQPHALCLAVAGRVVQCGVLVVVSQVQLGT